LWSIQDVNYIYAPAVSEYVSFPLGFPQQVEVVEFSLWQGLAPQELGPADGPQSSLVVALSEQLFTEDGVRTQVSIAPPGQRVDEEIVTASSQASSNPVLVVDERSHLHLAWLETAGFRQYHVVYASTVPEVVETYGRLTLSDVIDGVLDGIFASSTVLLSLSILLLVWAGAPFVGLLAYHLATNREMLDGTQSRVALIAALVVEAGLSFAVPSSRMGLGVPVWAAGWVVQLISLLVAAALTTYVIRHREMRHLFGLFFLFSIVNILVQGILLSVL
jgi:hypothetical protein